MVGGEKNGIRRWPGPLRAHLALRVHLESSILITVVASKALSGNRKVVPCGHVGLGT